MNIAICDDDKGVCSQLEGWIEQYNNENATRLYVDVYHSAETLQQQLQTGQWYDMLFLDIELPQKNGIELGQMIRSAWKMDLIYLVFISGKSNYCMDLFDVHPLNFHLKPLKHEDVVKDIELVRERINVGAFAFRYREDGVYKSVCLKDIVYFVGAGKGVEVHCKDGRVIFAGNSLQKLCDIYEKHGFSRCHKSYLINLNYVSEYSMSKVKMSDGKEIVIGKSRRKHFKDEFINHELMEDGDAFYYFLHYCQYISILRIMAIVPMLFWKKQAWGRH